MSRIVWCGCLLGLCLALGAARAQETRVDHGLLQGTWQAIDFKTDGGPPPLNDYRLTFTKDKFLLQYAKGNQSTWQFTLDATGQPKHIDLEGLDASFKGMKYQCLYKLEGDKFILAWPHAANTPRPRDFDAGLGLARSVITFQRVKE